MATDTEQKQKRGRAVRGHLPVILICALVTCTIILFSVVTYDRLITSSRLPYLDPSLSAAAAAAAGGTQWYHAHVHSSLQDASNSTQELHQLLKLMQQQLSDLQSSLPATIQEQLKGHRGSEEVRHQSTPQHQQQQHQQRSMPPQYDRPRGVTLPDHLVHHIGMARQACDKRTAAGIKLQVTDKLVAPVVFVAHNRVHYLAKALMQTLRYWSADPANAERFPLFVSVDGGDQATMQFAAALNYAAEVQVIHNLRDTSRCAPGLGYCNLSVHYHMLLQLFFECHKSPRLLFLEEDLEVSPDFFSYFNALAPLLDRDKSLMCVSAWNDHGQRGRALNTSAIYRTDIFPGLGWMLRADFAKEIIEEWPNMYWDEHMRRPEVRQGRQCIFPEVPRTHTFGKVGTSKGQFFDGHLAVMLLNQDNIDWSKQDLSYLEGPAYAQQMADWLQAAEPLDPSAVDLATYCAVSAHDFEETGDLVVRFRTNKEFTHLAGQLPPMLTDTKGGPVGPGIPLVPRASYKGIAIVRCRGRRLFMAPVPGSDAEPLVGANRTATAPDTGPAAAAAQPLQPATATGTATGAVPAARRRLHVGRL